MIDLMFYRFSKDCLKADPATGVMSGLLVAPEVFASVKNEERLPAPLLTSRNKENSYWYMGHLMSLLVASAQTGSRYALLRATERKGFEPPPHTHTKEDETFLILEGEVKYTRAYCSFRPFPKALLTFQN